MNMLYAMRSCCGAQTIAENRQQGADIYLHIAQNQKPMEGFLIWKTGI
jgi:hypothetical protein